MKKVNILPVSLKISCLLPCLAVMLFVGVPPQIVSAAPNDSHRTQNVKQADENPPVLPKIKISSDTLTEMLNAQELKTFPKPQIIRGGQNPTEFKVTLDRMTLAEPEIKLDVEKASVNAHVQELFACPETRQYILNLEVRKEDSPILFALKEIFELYASETSILQTRLQEKIDALFDICKQSNPKGDEFIYKNREMAFKSGAYGTIPQTIKAFDEMAPALRLVAEAKPRFQQAGIDMNVCRCGVCVPDSYTEGATISDFMPDGGFDRVYNNQRYIRLILNSMNPASKKFRNLSVLERGSFNDIGLKFATSILRPVYHTLWFGEFDICSISYKVQTGVDCSTKQAELVSVFTAKDYVVNNDFLHDITFTKCAGNRWRRIENDYVCFKDYSDVQSEMRNRPYIVLVFKVLN